MRALLGLLIAAFLAAAPAWAEDSPSPTIRTVAGKRPVGGDVPIAASDVGALPCIGTCAQLQTFIQQLVVLVPSASAIDVRTAISDAPNGADYIELQSGTIRSGGPLAMFVQSRYGLTSGQMAAVFQAASAVRSSLQPYAPPTLAQLGAAANDLSNVSAATGRAALQLGSLALYGSLAGLDASASTVLTSGSTVSQPLSTALAQFGVSPVGLGAKCDGGVSGTDDAPFLNAALSSGLPVILPSKECLALTPVVGPTAAPVTIVGTAFDNSNPYSPTATSGILCAATVSPCVTLGGNNKSVTASRFRVDRQGGQPTADKIGLQIVDAYNVTLDTIASRNHGQCYLIYAKTSGLGLGFMGTHVYSGACSDAHIVNNNWPEMRFSQSRFGMNGLGDYSAATYVRFQGGTPDTAAGPNTVSFTDTQFNQGSNLASHWLEFVNRNTAAGNYVNSTFTFTGVHVEAVSSAGIVSDNTWPFLGDFAMIGGDFLQTQVPFFSLNAATSFNDFHMAGYNIQASDTAIAPASQINQFVITDTTMQPGRLTIIGSANSVVDLHADNFIGGLTVTGFTGGLVNIYGGNNYGKFVNNLASGATLKMP